MARDLNKFIAIGRLTRDPELKYLQSGTAVANFSIANNDSYTKDGNKVEQVSFFNCVAWTKLGEVIVQYCKKGQQICITGRLQQETWEDQEGKKRSSIKVVCENVQFLGKSGETNNEESQQNEPEQPGKPAAEGPFSDDDIPF